MRLLELHLRRDAVDSVWRGLTTLGERHDSRTVRQLRERLLAAHGRDGDCEDTEDRARSGQSLSTGKEVDPDVGGRDRPGCRRRGRRRVNRTRPHDQRRARRSSPWSAALARSSTSAAFSASSPRAQVRRLWLRDRHGTYPGCDAPAAWCDAHHLAHWADVGRTGLDNAALLCQRHHTADHTQRLHRASGDGPPWGRP